MKLFKPITESVKNTKPSSSYPPPFSGAVVKLANLSWGVATKSHDDTKEYLHVLKAPAGNSLTLPPPADGKVFANARLLDGGRAVSLAQSNRGMILTLPNGVSQGIVDLSKGSGSFQSVFAKSGLPRGWHTLTGTKRGGAVMGW